MFLVATTKAGNLAMSNNRDCLTDFLAQKGRRDLQLIEKKHVCDRDINTNRQKAKQKISE